MKQDAGTASGSSHSVTKRAETKPEDSDPTIRATPFLELPPAGGPLLTDRQRQQLIAIATRLRLPARMQIYEEESAAKWLFIVTEGAVKTYRDLPSGRRRIANFLFRGDIFGLAEKGKYLNSAQSLTRVTLYRIALTSLTEAFHHDLTLQYPFLCKVTHELRESQRRAIAISRRDAPGRLAMFLVMLRRHLFGNDSQADTIPLVMSRSDIADFLGLSREATSRASTELERRGLVHFQRGRTVKIVDDGRLVKLAAAV